MAFYSVNRRFVAGLALTGFMLAAAGCQSSDNGILNFGLTKKDPAAPPPPQDPKILASQLRAYCPKVTLRDGTAYFNTYAKGATAKPKKKKLDPVAQAEAEAAAAAAQTGANGQPIDPAHDPSKIIYQASITDVTRDCTHANGQMSMKIAIAGKVVPGPVFTPGTVTMPIRIAVQRGDEVLYSQLHQYQVQVADPSAATQFVFVDSNVVVPEPSARDYQAYAGYDESTPASAAEKPKGKGKKRTPATN
ncbi:hypothetical protein [Mesorhizobium sp. B4-1-1]|uniref:hypothetical protein n=1 Tax=Mesorhizobium sp. B4-1-1 TaxID=2589890 RepID=UPI00112AF6D6|nr:hypothetical protein [Mesorhizobium sp. B4-1-1]TPI21882.1 hypothetical protein FJW10_05040 [Mesorhizobium sp. B4-1-1]